MTTQTSEVGPFSEFGEQIPNSLLQAHSIPVGTRDWSTFARFALRFDGYSFMGDFDRCAALANNAEQDYHRSGNLPRSISVLRTCLFFEQRRWRHSNLIPDEGSWKYLDALMARLRDLIASTSSEEAIDACLRWHTPIRLVATPTEGLDLTCDLGCIPATPGMYVFARRVRGRIDPWYIGLASRSLRRRLKEHLRSKKLVQGLFAPPRGPRLFLFAELDPSDTHFARRFLPSMESGLIALASANGLAHLNTHQRQRSAPDHAAKCTFQNVGDREAWSWTESRITVKLLPPRRASGAA